MEVRTMRWEKALPVGVAILLAVTAPAMAAQEAGKGEAKAAIRAASGTVTAVTPESGTVVVESTLGGKPWILGVEVPEGAAITAGGKTKKLEELKTGDRVRLRWIREENRLVAESISVISAKAQ
jgi:Cu/Ag efflux protein CusF